jgi:hypothetical protein
MAKPKKGQLAQFMVPMVDATDFASVESAVTASDFNSGATVKFYGLDQGGSAATTSGAVSKIASLVRSGVFRITLKGTENNYDAMMLRVNKTGCAEQIVCWENVSNDDSDLMSALTVIQSMASDAASAAQQGNSRVILVQSRLSDLDSRLASDISDILSGITALSGLTSDAHSAATLGASRALIIQSRLSDLDSRLVSDISDIRSMLSDMNSDLASKIGNVSVTITASDISDIASAVVAALPITSTVSDIYSLLSDLNSNFHSRIPKEPAARSQLSDLSSDLLSYLVGISGAVSDAHSAAILGASHASDVYSAAIVIQSRLSDLDSRLSSEVSDVISQLTVVQSMASDAHSAATVGASRALINQSRISDVQSFLSDFQSDLISHLDTTGVQLNASMLSDIRSAIAATELDASDLSDIASAVWARAGSDPTAVPGVTAGMGAKLDWLAAMSRNKLTQTATKQTLYQDDGTTVVASAVVSDDATTANRGEFG